MLHLDIAQQDHQKAGKSALHSQTWQVGLCLHGQQAQQLLLRIHVTLQCHAVLHSRTIEGWSGVNCFKMHTPNWNQRCDWNSVKNCRWIGVVPRNPVLIESLRCGYSKVPKFCTPQPVLPTDIQQTTRWAYIPIERQWSRSLNAG